MINPQLLKILGAAVVLCAASTVFADPGDYDPALPDNSGVYLGVQAGWEDTHWQDIQGLAINLGETTINIKDQGIGGRVLAGWDINNYFGIEAGLAYFAKTAINNAADQHVETYAADVVGKIIMPGQNGFTLYAKAGPGYIRTTDRYALAGSSAFTGGSKGTVNLVFGLGVSYTFNHVVTDLSWTHYQGNTDLNSNYQPPIDFIAIGLMLKS